MHSRRDMIGGALSGMLAARTVPGALGLAQRDAVEVTLIAIGGDCRSPEGYARTKQVRADLEAHGLQIIGTVHAVDERSKVWAQWVTDRATAELHERAILRGEQPPGYRLPHDLAIVGFSVWHPKA